MQRPDWTKSKTSECKFNLSNNTCIDTTIPNQLPQIDYSQMAAYPDELPIYQAICQYHNISINNVILGFGLGEILQRIYLHLDVGTVTVVTPTWAMSYIFLEIENIPHRCVEYYNFNQLDFEQLINHPSDTIYLASPNGINSHVFTQSQIQELLKVYKWVILDEAYMEFSKNNYSMINRIDQYRNLIILKTLSKSLAMPGLRLGYAISTPKVIELLQLCRPSCVSHTATVQVAKTAFSLIPAHISRMQETREYIEKRYSTIPSNGNYVLFNGTAPVQDGILTKEVAPGITRMSLFSMDLVPEILL